MKKCTRAAEGDARDSGEKRDVNRFAFHFIPPFPPVPRGYPLNGREC